MVLYVSHAEMTERFKDSLCEASSRCKELIKANDSEKPALFNKLIGSLKVAAGSVHQLAHSHNDPFYLGVRDVIESFVAFGQEYVWRTSDSPVWIKISESLDGMKENVLKMSSGKGRSRSDILDELTLREDKIKKELNEEVH